MSGNHEAPRVRACQIPEIEEAKEILRRHDRAMLWARALEKIPEARGPRRWASVIWGEIWLSGAAAPKVLLRLLGRILYLPSPLGEVLFTVAVLFLLTLLSASVIWLAELILTVLSILGI